MSDTRLTGQEATAKWDKTYKHGHLPTWFKRKIKLRAQLDDISVYRDAENLLYFGAHRRLFDHVGSIQLRHVAQRVMITQPYCDDDKAAAEFADKHSMLWKRGPQGLWQSGTVMYMFLPSGFDYSF